MSMIGNLRRVPEERLKLLLADAALFDDFLEEEGDRSMTLDLDKAWHGLQFLLTETAWDGPEPLNFLVGGGRELEVDMGYGPPRAFVAAEVSAIAGALAPLTRDVLKTRFDPKAMTAAELYPTIWDRADEHAENLEYLLGAFDRVKAFVEAAAAAKDGMLVYLT